MCPVMWADAAAAGGEHIRVGEATKSPVVRSQLNCRGQNTVAGPASETRAQVSPGTRPGQVI